MVPGKLGVILKRYCSFGVLLAFPRKGKLWFELTQVHGLKPEYVDIAQSLVSNHELNLEMHEHAICEYISNLNHKTYAVLTSKKHTSKSF